MLNQRFVVPETEIEDLKRAALQGSPDAALRLANHYQMIAFNPAEAERWLVVAADNGSIVGMYNLAQALRRSNEASKHARARYWFGRVAREGPEDLATRAERQLSELGAATPN